MAKKAAVVSPLGVPVVHKVRAIALGFYGASTDKDGSTHRLYPAGEEFLMEIYPSVGAPSWVDVLDEAA